MLKKHMAACLVASAFITMPVLAQTSTTPGATSPGANQPAMGASSGAGAGGAGAAASGGAAGRFITQQQPNQWRGSRLIGINVYGANNERIGDINEVLVDRSGNADAVVIGVGGFLGIGEKNVALPFNAFEWQMDDTRRTASASGTGSGAGGSGTAARSGAGTGDTAGAGSGAASTTAGGAAGTTAGGAAGTTASTGTAGSGTRSDSTGTTASTSAAGGSGSRSGTERGYPDHAVLRMTKADLENAPAFRYIGDREDRSGSGSGSGSGAGRSSGSGSGAGGGAGTGAGTPGTAPRQ
jgi:PRC-barrel domain